MQLNHKHDSKREDIVLYVNLIRKYTKIRSNIYFKKNLNLILSFDCCCLQLLQVWQ